MSKSLAFITFPNLFIILKDMMNASIPPRIWTRMLQKAFQKKGSPPSHLNSSDMFFDTSCIYCGYRGDSNSQKPDLHYDFPGESLLCTFCDGTCGKIESDHWCKLFTQIGRACT